ncbi:MAG: ATPase domain-containing protein [Candidatus Bathyarchaeia archaeon]
MTDVVKEALSTGCHTLDAILGGGFPRTQISLLYGVPETGKTTLALQCAKGVALKGLKTFYIDADGGVTPQRLAQISGDEVKDVAPRILFFAPKDFRELILLVESLDRYITSKTILLVVDTVTGLYRVQLAEGEEAFSVNRELNRLMAYLKRLAKTRLMAVLVLGQARSIIPSAQTASEKREDIVEPTARRVLSYWSSLVLRASPTLRTSIKEFVLERPAVKEARCFLRITDRGLEPSLNP